MGNLAKTQADIEVRIPTPILDTINKSLSELLRKNLSEITQEVNMAIEAGVKTDGTASQADRAVKDGRKAIKVVNEVRLTYTRPIDAGKKRLIDEVSRMLHPLEESTGKLDSMCMQRAAEIRAAELKAQREAEEAERKAREEAAKEEERRRNISLGKGGDGNVKPVEPEIPVTPTAQVGMRQATETRSIPDHDAILKAVAQDGVRKIPGVHIWCEWRFKVIDAKDVPEDIEINGKAYKFRRLSRR